MAGIIFPTDLQQVKPQDETLLLGADANNIARNIKASELVDYVKSNVPLDELAETISEQQDTISEQQTTASEQAQTIARLVATQSAPALEAELAAGKTDLASAITAKGVETAPTDSLATMADKVREVVQAPALDGESVTGETIFPQPYMWNLIREAYAHQMGAYKALILAEFYKGYDTIPLSGADAYYTCDGDFYDAATTHVWHDNNNKSNRYVIYYYENDGQNFNIADPSVCPRRMVVIGKVGNILCDVDGRITQIYNCGEIQDIQLNGTQPWESNVVLQIGNHDSGNVFRNNNNIINAVFIADNINGGSIFSHNVAVGNNTSYFDNIQNVAVYCKNNAGTIFSFGRFAFNNLSSVQIYCETNTGSLLSQYDHNSQYSIALGRLKKLEVIGLTINSGTIYLNLGNGYSKSTEISIPDLVSNSGTILNIDFNLIKVLDMPSLETNTGTILKTYYNVIAYGNLERVIVGNMQTSLDLSKWGASSVLVTPSGAIKLINNVRSGIYERISDRTGLSALTVTFGFKSTLDNYSTGTEEEIAEVVAAWTQLKADFTNNKNWNVA